MCLDSAVMCSSASPTHPRNQSLPAKDCLAHTVLPILDLLHAGGLKALIVALHDDLVATQERLPSRESEIEHLTPFLAVFGERGAHVSLCPRIRAWQW